MSYSITTKNGEINFKDKELVTIGSKAGFDVQLDVDFDCMLTLQYDKVNNKCIILNQLNNKNFLFKGAALPTSLEVDKVSKIMVQNSDEFVTIKVASEAVEIKNETLSENDFKTLYGEGRASFNDNIHYNNLKSFRWNNNAFLDYETCLTVLNQAEKAIKLILSIHFAYITLLRPMALKAEEVGSCAANPFADEIFKKYIVPEYCELASYLRHCSFLTFEE